MKLVYLAGNGQVGGAESVLLDLVAGIVQRQPEWQVSVVVPEHGELVARVRAAGATAHVLEYPPGLARLGEGSWTEAGTSRLRAAACLVASSPALLRYSHALGRLLNDCGVDVVHSHALKMHVLGALARPAGALLWHMHEFTSSRPISRRALRRLEHRCTAVVGISPRVAMDAESTLQRRVQCIRNGVDLVRFTSHGELLHLDALAGLAPAPDGVIRIGMVGALARWKGQELFLEALARLPADRPVRGYIIGDALYRTESSQFTLAHLRTRAAALGVTERVGFTGFVQHPEAAYRALDIVVHGALRAEPFGMVIAEAMASGRPVIAADGAGSMEQLRPGVDLSCVRADDADALSAAMLKLVDDRELRMQMGAAARKAAEAVFDRNHMITAIAELYRSVAKRN